MEGPIWRIKVVETGGRTARTAKPAKTAVFLPVYLHFSLLLFLFLHYESFRREEARRRTTGSTNLTGKSHIGTFDDTNSSGNPTFVAEKLDVITWRLDDLEERMYLRSESRSRSPAKNQQMKSPICQQGQLETSTSTAKKPVSPEEESLEKALQRSRHQRLLQGKLLMYDPSDFLELVQA